MVSESTPVDVFGTQISPDIGPNNALFALVERARALIGSQGATVLLMSNVYVRIEHAFTWEANESPEAMVKVPSLGVGILKSQMASGKCGVFFPLETDPLVESHPGGKILSLLGFPVSSKDKLHAIIYLTNKKGGTAFIDSDVDLFTQVGGIAEVALENRSLTFKVRQLEQQVLAIETQLKQAQKLEAIGQRAGPIAHNVNNLLSIILALSGQMLKDFSPDNPVRGQMEKIIRAAKNVAALNGQLQTFSRKKMNPPKSPILEASHQDSVGNSHSPPIRVRGSETILIVEESEEIRTLLRGILHANGYQVLETKHESEAILKCEQHAHAIQLVLTDVKMPLIDGQGFADHLHSSHPEMRLIFMSGHPDTPTISHGIAQFGAPLLEKPFTQNSLLSVVRSVLDSRVETK